MNFLFWDIVHHVDPNMHVAKLDILYNRVEHLNFIFYVVVIRTPSLVLV